jgi:hypothetical protein
MDGASYAVRKHVYVARRRLILMSLIRNDVISNPCDWHAFLHAPVS